MGYHRSFLKVLHCWRIRPFFFGAMFGGKKRVTYHWGLWTSCCECGRTFKRAARSSLFPGAGAVGQFVKFAVCHFNGIRKTQLSSLVCLRPKSNGVIMPIEMAIFGGWLAAPSGAHVRVGKRVACPMQGNVRCGWNLSLFPVSVATSSFH